MLVTKIEFFEKKHSDMEGWNNDGYLYFHTENGEKIWLDANICKELYYEKDKKDAKKLEKKKNVKSFVFFNCSIITTEGTFRKKKISLSELNYLIDENGINSFSSAIGHQSTADILNQLLCLTETDQEIPVNRVKFEQETGQTAIVFQLRSRPPEGKILSQKEIEKIGYDFYTIEKIAD